MNRGKALGPTTSTSARLTPAVALGLALLFIAARGVPAVAGENPARVSLAPSDAAGRPIGGSGYFVVDALPGSTFTGHVAAGNLGPASATVTLIAVDAATGPFGGVSYALPEQAREHVGSWIEVDTNSVSVAAGGAAIVAFSVSVPATAAPGEHLAGLAAFIALPPATSADAGLQVQQRAIVAVQVNVPGARAKQMAVSGLSAQGRPDGSYAVARLANSGNALLKSAGSLLITRRDGSTALSSPLSLETTVPGTEATYPVRWDPAPAAGRYHGHIELAWDGGSLVWDSDFDVEAAAAERPGDGAAGKGGFLLAARAQDGWPTLAFGILASTALLGGLVVIPVARRRRARSAAA